MLRQAIFADSIGGIFAQPKLCMVNDGREIHGTSDNRDASHLGKFW